MGAHVLGLMMLQLRLVGRNELTLLSEGPRLE